MDSKALIKERRKTHGDWHKQAACAQNLKTVIRHYASPDLPAFVVEALEMIAVKISRILCGDYKETDHFDDIQGYAELGKEGHADTDIREIAKKFAPKTDFSKPPTKTVPVDTY